MATRKSRPVSARRAASRKAPTRKSPTPKAPTPTARTRKARTGKTPPRKATGRSRPSGARAGDGPQLFRLNVEVGDLERAASFYQGLLGTVGRRQPGARVYFECGAVTLQVVDVSRGGAPHAAAKALYFSVVDLDAVFARAQELGGLSADDVHGESGGAITVRPWGERSFYLQDPWGNPLCFVERGTEYRG